MTSRVEESLNLAISKAGRSQVELAIACDLLLLTSHSVEEREELSDGMEHRLVDFPTMALPLATAAIVSGNDLEKAARALVAFTPSEEGLDHWRLSHLGIIQMRLGLYSEAIDSLRHSICDPVALLSGMHPCHGLVDEMIAVEGGRLGAFSGPIDDYLHWANSAILGRTDLMRAVASSARFRAQLFASMNGSAC